MNHDHERYKKPHIVGLVMFPTYIAIAFLAAMLPLQWWFLAVAVGIFGSGLAYKATILRTAARRGRVRLAILIMVALQALAIVLLVLLVRVILPLSMLSKSTVS